MGKSGKHRKRVRMLREHERAAAVIHDGGSGSAGGGGGGGNEGGSRKDGEGAVVGEEDEVYPGGIYPEDLATTVATLHSIGQDTELLKMKEFKALRGALHPVR